MTDTDRELLELAAKALHETWHSQPGYLPWQDGGNSLKQDEARELVRLAAHKLKPPLPVQEPTPWRDMVVVSLVREGINTHKARELADHFVNFTLTPPLREQRKALDDWVIDAIGHNIGVDIDSLWARKFARAIEAAHGIKEKNNG